ncbi:hypothetical protein [Sinorhizobium fredii]|uniref:hypothetical protein n=1 Tax=Rhizobium fredii TaxID=380 RepID=UPI001297D559|nr:hypothetical protein [Sinorhizobium fredii]MQW95661.1 hypothetical protein [Sinorhizobium fredii]UTY47311.1 hypothetical protein EPK84_11255 [Sinorhizobium fredii]
MPATTTYALTGNAYIDGVLGDWKWAVKDFTFSFPASASFYGNGYAWCRPPVSSADFGCRPSQQSTTDANLD